MRTSTCLIASLIVSLLITTSPMEAAERENIASEPNASASAVSNTRTASCMVKITTDPDVIWLNGETLMHLLYSPGVVGKAAQEVLGVRPSDRRQAESLLKIEAMRIGPASGRSRMPMEPGYEAMMMAEMEAMSRQEPMRHVDPPPAREKKRSTGGNSTNDAPNSIQPTDEQPAEGSAGMGGQGRGGYVGAMMGGQSTGGYGGMMGGQGMGGYGGGMMGGMYGGQAAPGQTTSREQSVSVEFWVELDEDLRPVAQGFAVAVVENLRRALGTIHEQHRRELAAQVDLAQSQWENAEEQLAQVRGLRSAASMAVEDQLSTIVDLSMLSPEMPFSEAVEVLRNSVAPPLQIAVMWRDLLENADVEPTNPIDLDPLPNVQVKTALEVMLKALGGGFAELTYQIKDNVVVVGTAESFETLDAWEDAPAGEMDARTLISQRHELSREIGTLELELAGLEARRMAIQEQIARTEDETGRKLEADTVTRELEKLVQMHIETLNTLRKQADAGRLSTAELARANENLTRAKIELARRREELSKSAGGARLEGYNDDLSRMAIDMAEKKAQLEILRRQSGVVQHQWARASQFDPVTARTRIAREALDIAARRVIELKTRLTNLRAPTVTMLGAN
ncbi:MAG: hypothetical protein JW741_04160 [Sedimentisphaerales bacterium]|nr:hypothetical protein [Sedimentisphaerales bacterium]